MFLLSSAASLNLGWSQNGVVWNGLSHCHIMPHFEALRYIAVENNVSKGEIACNKQFLLFSQCFLPYMMHFKCTLTLS